MGSYYYESYQNPLKTILGLAGISIDAICTDEKSRSIVRRLWKVHMEIERKMKQSRIEADKKHDEEFLKTWHDSVRDTAYFIKEQPRGVLKSIREEVDKFFN